MPAPKQNGSTNHFSTVKDLIGRRFTRLTVLSRFGTNENKHATWNCECVCGKNVVVPGVYLRNGNTKSCGCLRLDKFILRVTTHGHTKGDEKSGAYRSWAAMLNRATNPRGTDWQHYGGRGITVCDRWRQFENFFSDMGPRPKGLSLDRIDNEKGYESGNCQYTDQRTQVRNRRISKLNKTGVKGVSIYRDNKYMAGATVNGKKLHLGYFPRTPEGLQSAAEAIRIAKLKDIFS